MKTDKIKRYQSTELVENNCQIPDFVPALYIK